MEEVKTGTTTLCILCKDGVVVAADQKSTMGYLVSSKAMKKVFKISDYIAMTIAGTAGDAQALARLVTAELKLYQLQEGDVSVKTAAMLLSNILRSSFKSYRPDMVQLIIGGYDNKRGLQIYSLDLAGGIEDSKDYAFSGSGSVIAVGVLEDSYKKDMTTEEGVDLAIRALRSARERDIATGGNLLDIAVITKNNLEWVAAEKISAAIAKKKQV